MRKIYKYSNDCRFMTIKSIQTLILKSPEYKIDTIISEISPDWKEKPVYYFYLSNPRNGLEDYMTQVYTDIFDNFQKFKKTDYKHKNSDNNLTAVYKKDSQFIIKRQDPSGTQTLTNIHPRIFEDEKIEEPAQPKGVDIEMLNTIFAFNRLA